MPIDITRIIAPVQAALAPATEALSDAWSAVIGDRIAAWRLTNAARLQAAVIEEVSRLGLKLTSKIPERYAFSWFEEATKQDEPEIQQLFARLLARAAAGDDDAADRRHLEIVSRLTPMDAKVLVWLFTNSEHKHPSMNEYVAWKRTRDEFGESAALSIEHLITLGVFERLYGIKHDGSSRGWVTRDMPVDNILAHVEIDSELSATARGVSLYKACGPEAAPQT